MLSKVVRSQDLVKLAAAADDYLADPSRLSSRLFADQSARLFPIGTKEATLLSVAYFYGEPRRNRVVEENLKLAAHYWDVDDEADQIRQEVIGAAGQP